VIVDRAGRAGCGQTGRFLLPEGVARLVRAGLELGEADDRFFGRENSKQQEGAIGLLSNRKLDRLQLYKQGVIFALLRFVNAEFYEREASRDLGGFQRRTVEQGADGGQ